MLLLRFLVALLIFETLIYFLLELGGYKGFAAIPLARLGIFLFTSFFFLDYILKIKFNLSKLHLFSTQDLFIKFWFLFSFLELFIGIINNNPKLYIITDFVYIFFGLILYSAIKQNSDLDNKIIHSKVLAKYSFIIALLGYLLFFLNLKLPAIMLIVLVIFTYVSFLNKRYVKLVFILIPFLLEVSNANRSHLIVFFLMMFILFLRKIKEKYRAIDVALVFIFSFIGITYFLEEILGLILLIVDQKSMLGFRIGQLIDVLKNGIDYNSPYFTSIAIRVLELNAVMDYWTSDAYSFIFGSGLGGVLDGSNFNDSSVTNSALLGVKKIHNIHLMPFAFIFRYGVFGIIILILLIFRFYKSFVTVLKASKDLNIIFWNLFFILWIVFSIPAASFLWTSPFFWIACACLRHKQNENINAIKVE